jgi:hypothetical protein
MRGIARAVGVATVGVVTALLPAVGTATSAHAAGPTYNRVIGTNGDDRLRGTERADLVAGSAGNDVIRPDHGTDIIRAAGGDDRIFVFNDGDVDRIHCGDGFDVVAYHFSVDQHDIIDENCEGRIA